MPDEPRVTTFAGTILHDSEPVEGWITVEGNRIDAAGDGPPDTDPDVQGWIVPPPVNAHTHVGDSFLREREDKPRDLATLVGPGGWKHQHLAAADEAEQRQAIEATVEEMATLGTSHFIDFREGGIPGARVLTGIDLPVKPVIYGRGAGTFDEHEAEELLRIVDGLGLSGVRDLGRQLEQWAEAAHAARRPWAVHVSEDKRDADLEAVLTLEPRFIVHMCKATDADLRMAADHDVPIVVCPRSNAFFGMKTPVDRMLRAGCTVALGTDNGMLASGDVLAEARLLRQWFHIPEADLLTMATINGRHILGLPTPPPKPGPANHVVLPKGVLA